MIHITDKTLIKAHHKAYNLHLNKEFISILKIEIFLSLKNHYKRLILIRVVSLTISLGYAS